MALYYVWIASAISIGGALGRAVPALALYYVWIAGTAPKRLVPAYGATCFRRNVVLLGGKLGPAIRRRCFAELNLFQVADPRTRIPAPRRSTQQARRPSRPGSQSCLPLGYHRLASKRRPEQAASAQFRQWRCTTFGLPRRFQLVGALGRAVPAMAFYYVWIAGTAPKRLVPAYGAYGATCFRRNVVLLGGKLGPAIRRRCFAELNLFQVADLRTRIPAPRRSTQQARRPSRPGSQSCLPLGYHRLASKRRPEQAASAQFRQWRCTTFGLPELRRSGLFRPTVPTVLLAFVETSCCSVES
ncbi:hypothetical protein LF1_50560 [Rubripirellula obstinata]|uniref:Uncharacterized protein n=1 Tax=Rubripirellula obstinata TaxID=406547 RepID=A0A5B1CQH9_9BACT|nr:hypothetical protein LF1_50560 [Rubripirellula obstinata]